MSPTQRSLAKLRAEGWTPDVVERWIGGKTFRVRKDFLGFGDIVACCPGRGFLAVQTTSGSNVSSRVAKIKAEPRAQMFLASGGRIEVHGWAKRGERGKAKRWTCRVVNVS